MLKEMFSMVIDPSEGPKLPVASVPVFCRTVKGTSFKLISALGKSSALMATVASSPLKLKRRGMGGRGLGSSVSTKPKSPPPCALRETEEVKLMTQPCLLPPPGGRFPPGLGFGLGSTKVKGESAPQPENNDAARTAAQKIFNIRIGIPLGFIGFTPPHTPLPPSKNEAKGAGMLMLFPVDESQFVDRNSA